MRPEEVWGLEEKAHRLLQAAALEAYGRSGAYVTQEGVMHKADLTDLQEYWAIAEYLEERGWITECDDDYGVFVLTVEGLNEAMHY